MDSYSESSSFLNLLNSQQPNYEAPSQTVNNQTSEVPVFSTQQWSDEQNYEAPSHVDAHTDDRKERRKWSPIEDGMLISAWLNTSKDPVVGNEQKADAFWKRIAAYFAASPKLVGLKKRESSHCKQRWGKINEAICKFVGCYDAATKAKSSGQSENDVMKMANDIYFNDYKVKFTLEHAWRELRHDQKWCGSTSTKDIGGSKRRKFNDDSAHSSSSVAGEDEAMARPLGVKAAKRVAKRSLSKTTTVEEGKLLSDFERMWEIKQHDMVIKEKLNKQKLLESLLVKKEPLSEVENALKDKLINDMLAN